MVFVSKKKMIDINVNYIKHCMAAHLVKIASLLPLGSVVLWIYMTIQLL